MEIGNLLASFNEGTARRGNDSDRVFHYVRRMPSGKPESTLRRPQHLPQTLDVLLTRSEAVRHRTDRRRLRRIRILGQEFRRHRAVPGADGRVRDYSDFTAAAHAKGALVTVAADLLSLALLKAPGEWGARHRRGLAQRLGTPMGFGGPLRGIHDHARALSATCRAASSASRSTGWATRPAHGPCRCAGATHQARARHLEHLHRLGPDGLDDGLLLRLQRLRRGCRARRKPAHLAAATIARALERWTTAAPRRRSSSTRSSEVEAEAAVVQSLALEQGINYYPSEGRVRMSFDR